jgi:hypothetical protein
MNRDDKPWFAAKRYGYGAGLPIAWQGWVLLLGYLAVAGGLSPMALLAVFFISGSWWVAAPVFIVFMFVETTVFCVICAKKTEGGWRWRWGGKA